MTLLLSFLVGGFLCVIAQLLIDLTALTPARILVGMVCLGVFLGAIGLYDFIFKYAGCGISVPLIGYGGTISKGMREAIDKEGAIGILKGAFTASSVGCSAALIFGYLSAIIFKGKPKRL
ncbi:MAG: SpoVA/SpoVAEb family sporulation membrane protein [Clostridia bacterium]|nr:SpoVA/SpoVAEb family sporulation membrane protein [Clostridia bacterium]